MSPSASIAAVESQIPGRMRLRAPRKHREDFLGKTERFLEDIEGVLDVASNIVTGSMLVRYDPDVIDGDRLIQLGQNAGCIGDGAQSISKFENQFAPTSLTATQILKGFRRFDSTVSRVSRGTVDGKMLVSLTLLGMSLSRALLSDRRAPTPWHSLLWYSYSVFVQWHRPNNQP